MSKRFLPLILVVLAAAGAAQAQYGGGMGGGGEGGMGGHHGARRHRDRPSGPPDGGPGRPDRPQREADLGKVQIVGVIRAIDPAQGRVTIAYRPVDALNWPAGTTPFEVAKPALLQGLSVGESVRFHLDSQQITAIAPIGPSGSPGTR